jgi:hypothetical protein
MQNLNASSKPMSSPGHAGPGRNLLAMLIAFALVFSFFHGWASNGATDIAPAFVSASASGTQPKAPVQQAPVHDDHCLTHLVAWNVQEPVISPAVFGGSAYNVRDDVQPAGLAARSPFKPPRA